MAIGNIFVALPYQLLLVVQPLYCFFRFLCLTLLLFCNFPVNSKLAAKSPVMLIGCGTEMPTDVAILLL